MRRLSWGLAFVAMTGCAANGAAIASAAVNSAVAVGAGVVNVANGDCFTTCPRGSYCDASSKACVVLPCHDECASNEVCDQSGLIDHCVEMQIPVPLRVDEKAASAH
jgi:hypothetical protein